MSVQVSRGGHANILFITRYTCEIMLEHSVQLMEQQSMTNPPVTNLPAGKNDSLSIAISPTGEPTISKVYTVKARCGVAAIVRQGQLLTVTNTHGTQVCDFWAFAEQDPTEYLSMHHIHTALNSVFPGTGDGLVSNHRRLMMTMVEDTSPGVHDTVIACCDHQRYQQLGCSTYHDNCADNLRMAMMAINRDPPAVPAPFNLWMNIPIATDGSIEWLPTVSAPGDYITFRAETDLIAVMSACPQDITPINGTDSVPTELHFSVTESV